MNPERVRQIKITVIVFERQTSPSTSRQLFEAADKALSGDKRLSVGAANMNDQHGVFVQPHAVQKTCRRLQLDSSTSPHLLIRAAHLDVKRGMNG